MEYYTFLFVIYFLVGILELMYNYSPMVKKICSYFCLLPLAVMTAFRDFSVGNDTWTYYYTYDIISFSDSLSNSLEYSRMEPGYVALNYTFSQLGFEYIVMQAIISFFIYFSLIHFIGKYSVNVGFSCIVFLGMRMFCGPMNVVRMWIALCFLLYAIDYIRSRNIICAVFFIACGSLFHYSLAICFPLIFISNLNFNFKNVITMITLSVSFATLGKSFFEIVTRYTGLYQGYLNSNYFDIENNIAIYLTAGLDVIFLIFTLFMLKKEIVSLKSIELKVFLFMSVITICIDILGFSNSIMGRLSGYFSICWLVLLPLAIENINSKVHRIGVFMLFSLCFYLQLYIVMLYRPQWNGVVPYIWY